jgi:hypothetical protein
VAIEQELQAGQSKKAKLSASSKVALNAFYEAIIEMGEVPPASNHIPPGTKAVTIEQWRYTPIGAASTYRASRGRARKRSIPPWWLSKREGHRGLGTPCLARLDGRVFCTKRTLLRRVFALSKS